MIGRDVQTTTAGRSKRLSLDPLAPALTLWPYHSETFLLIMIARRLS